MRNNNVLAMGVSYVNPYGTKGMSPIFRLLAGVQNTSHVFRYNLQPVFFKQNIAEHMGRCCILASLICSEMSLGSDVTTEVMTKISLHDMHETITGEVVHPTKHHPFFSDTFLKFESEVENHLFMRYSSSPDKFQDILNTLHHPDNQVDYLCDIIDLAELVIYCTTEVQMGNNHVAYMLKDSMGTLALMADGFYSTYKLKVHGDNTVLWAILTSARLTLGGGPNPSIEE